VVHHSIANVVSIPDSVPPDQLLTGKKQGTTGWKLVGQAPGKGSARVPAREPPSGSVRDPISSSTCITRRRGKVETDKSVLGFWFAKGPIHHEVLSRMAREETLLNDKVVGRGRVAEYSSEHRQLGDHRPDAREGRSDVIRDCRRTCIFRGKDMKYTLVYPDGREEVLLNVPKYNYEWQINYDHRDAQEDSRPAASFTVTAHYDNSKNNPRNPAPDEEVIWGQPELE